MEMSLAREAAQILWNAWQQQRRIGALPERCRPATRAEGYQIQAAILALSGRAQFGWKIAATSGAGQAHIGVAGPLAGRLIEGRIHASGDAVPLAGTQMHVAEVEFAFRMARDLPPRDRPYTVDEVLEAVESLHPAIEVPDSRYEDFVRAGGPQLIADNACAHRFVLGPACTVDWRAIDLRAQVVACAPDGRALLQGKGENVLGDPRIALAWIANELSGIGERLARGQVITTGTCLAPVPVAPGDRIAADFGPIGRVEARFVE